MTKTIAQLWNGNLAPVRHCGENNPDIQELESLIQRNNEKLEAALSDKAKNIFENYKICIEEYRYIINEQAFCDGFCLGTRITAEALDHALIP